jgi:hypothetical protein
MPKHAPDGEAACLMVEEAQAASKTSSWQQDLPGRAFRPSINKCGAPIWLGRSVSRRKSAAATSRKGSVCFTDFSTRATVTLTHLELALPGKAV